ncbi:hypothetical protein AXG93_80s1000 [Marchantia polymorpha subsp. ruderalis]|uniref:CCHC-type domain-containing protein n=1 Tax=Marchantia polymorpha subsp. ruderalis TaxID=1480154 RepID=A0A176W1P8_MARPO|nr:hypothetical protein AXG93_80s1000 [Marchantia polymorpha subsp. ruderalis]
MSLSRLRPTRSRPKDRPFDERKSKSSQRKQRAVTPSSSESSLSSKSSELEDSSSSEDGKPLKKANGEKKKNRRMAMPKKGSTSIVSKVAALVKDFADLKMHVVGSREKRKSPIGLKANLWCTNCGRVGHANVECRTYQSVNVVEWVPAREAVRFVTPPSKEDAQVYLVKLSSEDKEEDNSWPDEETMIGRVETRSSSRKKETTLEKSKRDKTGAKKKDSKGKESRELHKDPPPKASESLAKKAKSSAEEL